MKMNRWFIIGVVAFLLLIFFLHYQMPQEFVWKPTYAHSDRQPFGCFVFDSLLSENMPEGYSVTDKSLPILAKDSTPRGILVVSDEVSMSDVDMESLYKLLHDGSQVLIATNNMGNRLEDTLQLATRYSYNYLKLKDFIKKKEKRDTLRWQTDTLGTEPREYALFSPLCEWYLVELSIEEADTVEVEADSIDIKETVELEEEPAETDDNAKSDGGSFEVRPTDKPKAITPKETPKQTARDTIIYMATFDDRPIAYTEQVGRGRVTIVCAPLLFTNYTMLDMDNAGLVFRFLSTMKHLPVVRTTTFCPEALDASQSTPLRYFLAHPPLRWAIYLSLGLALLCLLFTARRRQRVIPVIKEPENHTIEFIELIGTLYYQSRERRSLVQRKYAYFAEELRRTIHVDITDDFDDGTEMVTIANQSGIPVEEVKHLIEELRMLEAADEETEISRKEMKRLIDEMNKIIKNI